MVTPLFLNHILAQRLFRIPNHVASHFVEGVKALLHRTESKPCLNDLAEIARSSELTPGAGHALVGVVAGHRRGLWTQMCPSLLRGLLGCLIEVFLILGLFIFVS